MALPALISQATPARHSSNKSTLGDSLAASSQGDNLATSSQNDSLAAASGHTAIAQSKENALLVVQLLCQALYTLGRCPGLVPLPEETSMIGKLFLPLRHYHCLLLDHCVFPSFRFREGCPYSLAPPK